MYTLYKFNFLNGISEINQLFDDILIIWPAPVYIYTYIYIQVHLKRFEYHEKGQYFLSLLSESETHILNRFITQSEIFQAFISWNFDDYALKIMKTQND